jgi:hypothetical protein
MAWGRILFLPVIQSAKTLAYFKISENLINKKRVKDVQRGVLEEGLFENKNTFKISCVKGKFFSHFQ